MEDLLDSLDSIDDDDIDLSNLLSSTILRNYTSDEELSRLLNNGKTAVRIMNDYNNIDHQKLVDYIKEINDLFQHYLIYFPNFTTSDHQLLENIIRQMNEWRIFFGHENTSYYSLVRNSLDILRQIYVLFLVDSREPVGKFEDIFTD